jgi:hypothetical protein
MKKLKFEDKQCFISNGVNVQTIPKNYKYGITNDASNYIDEKELYSSCRLLMFPVRFERIDFIVDYLFWFKETNLAELDSKVENDSYSEGDFEYSVVTSFISKVRCRNCHSVFRGALVIENSTFMYLYRNWEMKAEQLRKLNAIKECPVCGGSFGIKVMELFK